MSRGYIINLHQSVANFIQMKKNIITSRSKPTEKSYSQFYYMASILIFGPIFHRGSYKITVMSVRRCVCPSVSSTFVSEMVH